MMNKLVKKDLTQEIAAVIRAAKGENNLWSLLKHYHPLDVAKTVTQLTDTERQRLFHLLDAQALAEVFPYLDDAAHCLAELPEPLAAQVVAGMDAGDALEILRELPAEKKQAIAAHLAELPPVAVYEPEYVPRPPQIDTSEPLNIQQEDNTWLVEGPWLQRLMANINFSDYESRMYFDKMLRQSGLFDQLERMGIQDGDIVSMYNLEFEYQR